VKFDQWLKYIFIYRRKPGFDEGFLMASPGVLVPVFGSAGCAAASLFQCSFQPKISGPET